MRFGQAKELSFLCAYPEVQKEKNQEIQIEVQIAVQTSAGDRADLVNTWVSFFFLNVIERSEQVAFEGKSYVAGGPPELKSPDPLALMCFACLVFEIIGGWPPQKKGETGSVNTAQG